MVGIRLRGKDMGLEGDRQVASDISDGHQGVDWKTPGYMIRKEAQKDKFRTRAEKRGYGNQTCDKWYKVITREGLPKYLERGQGKKIDKNSQMDTSK